MGSAYAILQFFTNGRSLLLLPLVFVLGAATVRLPARPSMAFPFAARASPSVATPTCAAAFHPTKNVAAIVYLCKEEKKQLKLDKERTAQRLDRVDVCYYWEICRSCVTWIH